MQHCCAPCGSEHIRRNGSSQGPARYQCTACSHQARFVPAAVARALRYAQVEKLLAEFNSHRSIVRLTGVVRMTVAKLLKESAGRKQALAPPGAEKSPTPGMGSARVG